jgi:hypothetical protein
VLVVVSVTVAVTLVTGVRVVVILAVNVAWEVTVDVLVAATAVYVLAVTPQHEQALLYAAALQSLA